MTAPLLKSPDKVSDFHREDTELVRRIQLGDDKAFTELVYKYQNHILNYLSRMCQDTGEVEDLTQEVFERVHRHIGGFDPQRKFSNWIYTIAGNLAKNHHRNRKRKRLVYIPAVYNDKSKESLMALAFEDVKSRPDVLFHSRELQKLIEVTLASLAPAQREVLVLRELEGKSYEEMAEICRINIGTVKSRLNRARISFATRILPHLD